MSELLTPATLSAYVVRAGLFPRDCATLNVTEISGGNLNFSFHVTDTRSGHSVFVKQTPGFVKCLGPSVALGRQRLLVETRAYKEWKEALGDTLSASCLPRLLHFDEENMVLVLEWLGNSQLLHERLVAGSIDESVSQKLGKFLGAAHALTHGAIVAPERAAELASAFANPELRELQLEYVFTKPFREAERAAPLRDDASFMAELDALKSTYRGERGLARQALCHGDLHAGSLMVDRACGGVKVIDTEFAVFGPPGLDLGSLTSSHLLAALQHAAVGAHGAVRQLRTSVGELWSVYAASLRQHGLPDATVAEIGTDAAGFAGCEIARTALGFAGGRGLELRDAGTKDKTEMEALRLARRLIVGREQAAAGVAAVLSVLDDHLAALGDQGAADI